MKTLLLCLTAAVVARPLGAQHPELERQLVAARDTVWRAWFGNDTALLRRYLPPAAASVDGATPRWSDRRQIVAESRGFVRSKARLVGLTFSNTQIAPAGRSALVRSDYVTVVDVGGRRDTTRGRATELFVRQGDTWINPYWQLEPAATLPNASRELLLADTLGARFAIGDSARRLGTLADYDALLGTWAFRFQGRLPDGSYYQPFTGHWTFEKKDGGGLIEDRWRPDDPSVPMSNSLYTYRLFDTERRVWQIVGMSSAGGTIQPGTTWSDGANRYVIQRDGDALSRIRYLSIEPDHFLWRADRSTDGGRTWTLDASLMEAWRIAK